ncbi:hypothetical protein [Streptacidiphilus sp. EB129]|uniref:hypothetical protein n=1 Tax=Streptacidiphilus sp. EB129 TaxID=3156262 RepID=UPI00351677B2
MSLALPTTTAARGGLHRTTSPRLPLAWKLPAAGRADRLAWALVGLGLALLPWLATLGAAGEWNWVGLDALEAAGLISTGLLLRRADPRHGLTAVATAALLLTDAWFDITTAAPGTDLAVALAMAAFLELPISVLCTRLALRASV